MLIYLQSISRPNISIVTHQAARFLINPNISHKRAVHRIGIYLKVTRDKGSIFNPRLTKELECNVYVDFAGGWDKDNSGNSGAFLSRTVYIIMYADFLVLWCSKFQT